ncbi:Autophagy protein 22 [Rhizoclosmatium sp. JEL0117]|nr:Autophagy protein 22 [Rhizoclosmatium sp. JEL0117]
MTSQEPAVELKVVEEKGDVAAPAGLALINDEFKDIDTTPVSKKELSAFYMMGAAMDPTTFGSMGFYIPLIIQTLTAGSGFTRVDHSVPCDISKSYVCDVQFGSSWVDTTSMVFYGVVASTLALAIIFVGFGSIPDHGPYRKSLWIIFSVIGSFAAMLFPALTSYNTWIYGWVLTQIIAVSLGVCWMLVYAYMPLLVRNQPEFLEKAQDPNATRESLLKELDAVTNTISSRGFIWMYGSTLGFLILSIAFALFYTPAKPLPETYALQISVSFFGLVWFLGIFYVAKFLRVRPGPPFPEGTNVLTYSTKKVFVAFSKARQLKNLFIFLAGWFLYGDSFYTLSSVAILWAQSHLGFTTKDTLVLAVEVPICGILGAFLWKKAQDRFGWTSKKTLMLQNGLYTLIPLWGILGFFNLPIGYQTKVEIYIAGGLHGLLLGATQSTCRTLFAQLLPPGSEAEFYSLYEITDKCSAWLGPLIVAIIDNSGANKLWSMVFLALQFMAAWSFFIFVDVDQGIIDGREFGKMERERERGHQTQ